MRTNVESLFFVMLSFDQVFIGQTEADFYNALYFRQFSFCEVALFPNHNEAHLYAQQRYNSLFLANPHLYGFAPMPLPINCGKIGYNIRANSPVEITADSSSNATDSANFPALCEFPQTSQFAQLISRQNVNDGLFWAVDAINGFAVADNLNDLIHLLADSELVYGHAVPCGDESSAALFSRSAYLKRFSSRYRFDEGIALPTNPIRNGQIFIDSHYENREKRRSNNSSVNQLLSVGML